MFWFRSFSIGSVAVLLGACSELGEALCRTNPQDLGCFEGERQVGSCDDAAHPCRSATDCDADVETFCEELPPCDEAEGDEPCFDDAAEGEAEGDVADAPCDPNEDPTDAYVCGDDNSTLLCEDADGDGRFNWHRNFDCDEIGGTCDEALQGSSNGGCRDVGVGGDCLILDPARPELGPLSCADGLACVGQDGSSAGACE